MSSLHANTDLTYRRFLHEKVLHDLNTHQFSMPYYTCSHTY